MRRLIKLLSPLIFAAIFISCAQSVKQDGSITLDAEALVSRIVQYSNNRSAEYGAGKREFNDEQKQAINDALKFNVLLSVEICDEHENYNDSAEEEYTGDYFGNPLFGKKEIKFDNVPVGNKVYIIATVTSKLAIKDMDALASLATVCDMPAEAFLASNEEGFMEFLAEEFGWNFKCSGEAEHSVVAGENQVPLKLKWVDSSTGEEGVEIGGIIEPKIPQQLTIKINESKSDSSFYLNKGTIVFKLLDKDGNDLTVDPENESSGGANWEYKLSLKNSVIPATDNNVEPSITYYTYSPGKIELKKLPTGGNYQLYVQATPIANGYSDCATTSAIFDLPVELYSYYSYSVNSEADDYIDFDNEMNEGNIALSDATTDVYIKLYGEDDQAASDGLFHILNQIKNFFTYYQYYFFIDISEVTSVGNRNDLDSYILQDLYKLKGIKMPNSATSYMAGVFQDCEALEYVRFGEDTISISKPGIASSDLFQNCTKLSKVEFANIEGWYYSNDYVVSSYDSIDWDALTATAISTDGNSTPITINIYPVTDMSDPEQNAAKIQSGAWKCLVRKTE